MALVAAVAMAVSGVTTQVSAAPFAAIGADRMVGESQIIEVSSRKRHAAAKHRRARANANAAIGAAVAIGVLGIAAAAAAQPRRGQYIVDNRYYPVDAWGEPIYGARRVQQYEPGYYYEDAPRYRTYREPAWGGHRPAPYGYGYSRQPVYVDQGYSPGWNRRDQRRAAEAEAWHRQQRAVRVQPQPHWGGGYAHPPHYTQRRVQRGPYNEYNGGGNGSN